MITTKIRQVQSIKANGMQLAPPFRALNTGWDRKVLGRSLNCLPFVSRNERVTSAQRKRQQRTANMSEIEIRKVGG